MKAVSPSLRAFCALLGLVILTIPAVARADQWLFDHEDMRYPTLAKPKSVSPSFAGGLTLLATEEAVKLGPCKDDQTGLSGTLFNRLNGMGEATLTSNNSVSEPSPCPIEGIKECQVKKLEPVDFGTPWSFTIENPYKGTISGVSFTIELTGTCPGSPLPKEFKATGTLEGAFVDFQEKVAPFPARVVFEEAGPLKFEGHEFVVNGYLSFGTQFTALPEPKGFTPESSPARIDGTKLATTIFKRTSRTVECEEAAVTATAKAGDTTVDVTPTYGNCKTAAGPATIKMNGCTYRLHLRAEIGEDEVPTYTAPTDLICPAGKEVEIDVYTSEANHKAGTALCRYVLSPAANEGLNTVELTDKDVYDTKSLEPGWIEAHLELEGIVTKRVVGTTLVCGAENDGAGILTGKLKLTGTTHEGKGANGIAVFPPE